MDTRVEVAVARAIATLDPDLERRLESDPQAHLDLVVMTADAHRAAGTLLQSAVDAARSAGLSWGAVGDALGMSRQAAQQRFGHPAPSPAAGAAGESRRLVGINAFNEMSTLEEWGRHGWHSVGFGPAFHDVERTDHRWEHRRVLVGTGTAPDLIDRGWHRIGTLWFPWVYLKRELDEVAEPGEPT